MLDKETRELLSATVIEAMKGLGVVERKGIHGVEDKTMKYTGENDGFKSFGEFLTTVRANPQDARLKAGLSEGTDTAGGFLVPEGFNSNILMTAIENSVVRPNGATIFKMTSDNLKIPKIVDTSHQSGSGVAGGVIAHWVEEAGTKTVEEPVIGQINLIAKKLTGYTYCSDELLEDSAVNLEVFLTRLFGQTLGWYEDMAFINGSGVGEPLGFMQSGALIASTRATASSVTLADLALMWTRMYPSSLSRCVWLCNPVVLGQLAQLATTNLTWLKLDQGVAKPMPTTLFGRPLYTTEKLPTLNTKGDICLVDLSYYLIGDRQRMKIAVSPHLRFLTDETAWRFVTRVDGQPWVDAVLTPYAGSTLSPFVALDTK